MEKKKAKERKMTSEEVQGLLWMRKRAFKIENKKGKGSYKRKKKNLIFIKKYDIIYM